MHPANAVVGRDGQAVTLPLKPQIQERVLQQRQGPRLALHVLQEQVGQARLQGAAGDAAGCSMAMRSSSLVIGPTSSWPSDSAAARSGYAAIQT